MDILRFSAKVVQEIPGPKGSKTLVVQIYLKDKKFGEPYLRHSGSMFETFFHFQKSERHFALYSAHTTATRLMELFPCENRWVDLSGEEESAGGFCPVEFYVPELLDSISKDRFNPSEVLPGCLVREDLEEKEFLEIIHPPKFGLVAGCVWMDEHYMKIQYLDLSKVEDGIFTRDDRFGRIMLARGTKLRDVVSNEFDILIAGKIHIATVQEYELDTGKRREAR